MMSQFLSPAFNQRSDAYGGSVKNRARALLEVLQKVRAEVGPEYPVLVKMNCQDFLPEGLELENSIQVALELQEAGIDAIELSGGTIVSGEVSHCREGISSEEKEAYFREEAKAVKGKLQVPLILVGGIRSFHLADRLVARSHQTMGIRRCAEGKVPLGQPVSRPCLGRRSASLCGGEEAERKKIGDL
jgi:2,4-dienoyl-CoA reductase-like NADH-dependent reductase (Old Yellow Enzyme family)